MRQAAAFMKDSRDLSREQYAEWQLIFDRLRELQGTSALYDNDGTLDTPSYEGVIPQLRKLLAHPDVLLPFALFFNDANLLHVARIATKQIDYGALLPEVRAVWESTGEA